MGEKNLDLVDKIMGAITGTGQGEWDELLMHDPLITAADDRFYGALARIEKLISKDICAELEDAYSSAMSATGDVGILFGIHVADAIRDVASRPADLSRRVLNRMEGRTTA